MAPKSAILSPLLLALTAANPMANHGHWQRDGSGVHHTSRDPSATDGNSVLTADVSTYPADLGSSTSSTAVISTKRTKAKTTSSTLASDESSYPSVWDSAVSSSSSKSKSKMPGGTGTGTGRNHATTTADAPAWITSSGPSDIVPSALTATSFTTITVYVTRCSTGGCATDAPSSVVPPSDVPSIYLPPSSAPPYPIPTTCTCSTHGPYAPSAGIHHDHGACGPQYGKRHCKPGYCCGSDGTCGQGPRYCEHGCRPSFGTCSLSVPMGTGYTAHPRPTTFEPGACQAAPRKTNSPIPHNSKYKTTSHTLERRASQVDVVTAIATDESLSTSSSKHPGTAYATENIEASTLISAHHTGATKAAQSTHKKSKTSSSTQKTKPTGIIGYISDLPICTGGPHEKTILPGNHHTGYHQGTVAVTALSTTTSHHSSHNTHKTSSTSAEVSAATSHHSSPGTHRTSSTSAEASATNSA